MNGRTACRACPRRCGENNRCGVPFDMIVARTGLHFGEEPCIGGVRGSGAIFFAGCNLGCAFCQNVEISRRPALDAYRAFSPRDLADAFRKLEDAGAHNVNLVTGSHYVGQILAAFRLYRPKIPVVWNTSAYETTDAIDRLAEYVSVWLPDLKFFDPALSAALADAPDYFEVAFSAIERMRTHAPDDRFDRDGVMTDGMLVRHLVLPGHSRDSLDVLNAIARLNPAPRVSVMSQYVPSGKAASLRDLGRRLTSYEYKKVLSRVRELGLDGYTQERASATAELLPEWGEYLD